MQWTCVTFTNVSVFFFIYSCRNLMSDCVLRKHLQRRRETSTWKSWFHISCSSACAGHSSSCPFQQKVHSVPGIAIITASVMESFHALKKVKTRGHLGGIWAVGSIQGWWLISACLLHCLPLSITVLFGDAINHSDEEIRSIAMATTEAVAAWLPWRSLVLLTKLDKLSPDWNL